MKTLSLPQRWRITIFWGFLFTCKTILATLVIALENLAKSRYHFISQTIQNLETQAQQIGVFLINFYQKYISPHKGFACAHRVLHGGNSCSQHVKNLLIEQDLQSAIQLSRQRFQACKDARIILHSEQIDSEDFEKETPQKEPEKNKFCNESTCNTITLPFECADVCFDITPDCSDINLDCAPDCSNLNLDCTPDCGDCASGLDCTPSCDCG